MPHCTVYFCQIDSKGGSFFRSTRYDVGKYRKRILFLFNDNLSFYIFNLRFERSDVSRFIPREECKTFLKMKKKSLFYARTYHYSNAVGSVGDKDDSLLNFQARRIVRKWPTFL